MSEFDTETIRTLIDLLNPLHGSLDEQLYDERMREELEIPRDREYSVNVTEAQERNLTQAVCILEDRLRQSGAGTPDVNAEMLAALKDCVLILECWIKGRGQDPSIATPESGLGKARAAIRRAEAAQASGK